MVEERLEPRWSPQQIGGWHLPGSDPDQLDRAVLLRLQTAGVPLGQATTQAGMRWPPPATCSPPTHPTRIRRTIGSSGFGTSCPRQLPRAVPGPGLVAVRARRAIPGRPLPDHEGGHRLRHPAAGPSKPPAGITRRWLNEQYVRRGHGCEELAARIGVHPNTVIDWCRRYNLPARLDTAARATASTTCPMCCGPR